jgi:glycosyltransferase involved in cell wall biosynthesis
MEIAIAANYDLSDIRRGSGTFYSMAREMERQGHVVHRIGPLDVPLPFAHRILVALNRKLGTRNHSYLDPFLGRARGRLVNQRLASLQYEVLLTKDFCLAAFSDCPKPVVLYTDLLFPRFYRENVNPSHANMMFLSIWAAHYCTDRGLQRADLSVFPVEWAVDEALKYKSARRERMHVVPFGANVADPTDRVAGGRSIAHIKQKGTFDLLFIGKDWFRKGGKTAIEAAGRLKEAGINASLHIVGAKPSEPPPADNAVRFYGMLEKSIEQDWRILDGLYRKCDALILPSLAEGFVNVALESAAYGLPVLAYDTQGVRGAVLHEESGVLFPLGAPAQVFSDAVVRWYQEPGTYQRLVAGARRHYEGRVNWPTSVSALMRLVEQLIRPAKTSVRTPVA